MQKRAQQIVWTTIFVAGLVGFIPGVWDGVAYTYRKASKRIANGDVIKIEAMCYKVPSDWFIDNVRSGTPGIVYNLIGRKGDRYFLLLVYRDSRISRPIDPRTIRLRENLFNVYELEGQPLEKELRYWSLFSNNLVVMGTTLESVRDLSLAIQPIECANK